MSKRAKVKTKDWHEVWGKSMEKKGQMSSEFPLRIRETLPGGVTQSQIEEDFGNHEERQVGVERDVMKVGWL